MMDFEQAKKVLQLTDARVRKFGSVDASTGPCQRNCKVMTTI